MDAFERAFLFHFYGIDVPRVAEGDPELLNTPQFREWLKQAIRNGELPPQALWTMSPEELMRRFWETLRKQMEAHQGGSKLDRHRRQLAVRPLGQREGRRARRRTRGQPVGASKVIGERRYVEYSETTASAARISPRPWRRSRSLAPAGPRDELDLDETIYQSARNGGEIDLVFRRGLLDRIEVVLLIDNGGSSMLPFVDLTRLLFAKVRDRFKRCDTYFFHNTVYGAVYKDFRAPRSAAHARACCSATRRRRCCSSGDASMAPEELIWPRGAITWGDEDEEASLVWLQRLRDRFRHSVWLNPIPKGAGKGLRRHHDPQHRRGLPDGGPHPGRDPARRRAPERRLNGKNRGKKKAPPDRPPGRSSKRGGWNRMPSSSCILGGEPYGQHYEGDAAPLFPAFLRSARRAAEAASSSRSRRSRSSPAPSSRPSLPLSSSSRLSAATRNAPSWALPPLRVWATKASSCRSPRASAPRIRSSRRGVSVTKLST